MKIGYLTMERADNRRLNSVGSSRIRGRWVIKYCPEMSEFENGLHYDAMIYQKAYWMEHMEAFNGPKIFDICDPDWLDGRPIRQVVDNVDAITVSTEALQKFFRQLTDKPVVIIPDRIDPEEFQSRKLAHSSKMRNVVWFGYSTNQVVLDPVVGSLRDKGLNLVVISDRPYHDADINITYSYDTINAEIVKYDAVLLPHVAGNYRHQFKSNNKTLNAWALGMPVIKDYEDMEAFETQELREIESKRVYDLVRQDFHVKESAKQYLELISQLQGGQNEPK